MPPSASPPEPSTLSTNLQPSPPTRPSQPPYLLLTGSLLLLTTTTLTHRLILHRRRLTTPKYFHMSNFLPASHPITHVPTTSIPAATSTPARNTVSGPLEALTALTLSTLNVVAFAIMAVGGVGWALDIDDLGVLRERVKESRRERREVGGGLGGDGKGMEEKRRRGEEEEEMAGREWGGLVEGAMGGRGEGEGG